MNRYFLFYVLLCIVVLTQSLYADNNRKFFLRPSLGIALIPCMNIYQFNGIYNLEKKDLVNNNITTSIYGFDAGFYLNSDTDELSRWRFLLSAYYQAQITDTQKNSSGIISKYSATVNNTFLQVALEYDFYRNHNFSSYVGLGFLEGKVDFRGTYYKADSPKLANNLYISERYVSPSISLGSNYQLSKGYYLGAKYLLNIIPRQIIEKTPTSVIEFNSSGTFVNDFMLTFTYVY